MENLATLFLPEQPRGNSTFEQKDDYIVAPDVSQSESDEITSPDQPLTTAEIQNKPPKRKEPVVFLPRPRDPRQRFKVLQKFEGTLLEIAHNECRAHIRDLTSPGYVEEVTFPLETFQ